MLSMPYFTENEPIEDQAALGDQFNAVVHNPSHEGLRGLAGRMAATLPSAVLMGLSGNLLACLPQESAEPLASAVLVDLGVSVAGVGAGTPMPPLLTAMDEARHWVTFAHPREIEALVWVGLSAMSPERQAALIRHAQRNFAA